MNITTRVFDLPLRDPFTIARGTVTVQTTWIVSIEKDGFTGLGEATVNDFYGADVASMEKAIDQVRGLISQLDWMPPPDLWAKLDPILSNNRFAQCALDCAYWDLWGKRQGLPVWKAMGLSLERIPNSCYTIGIDRPEIMMRKLREMPGWPVYKVKMGTEGDLETLKLLRSITTAPFRVDANCGWTLENSRRMLDELAKLNVELIEQPLPIDMLEAMPQLKASSSLPLMADESCQVESDVDRCASGFHAINIKLVKCGGITPGVRMARRARELGMKVMVGCMTESSIGISASAQLLPLLDYADLDGAVLLAKDIATGVKIDQGRPLFPEAPGLGVAWID